MTSAGKGSRVRDLVALLDGLRGLYEQLSEAIEAKMAALRIADLAGMSVWQEKEQAIAKRVEERLGFRRQLMERLGPELGVSPREARVMTMSNLLTRVPQGERGRLVDAVHALRGVVFKASQANRRLGAASRELLHHIQWVLSAVRPKDDAPNAYSQQGVRQTAGGAYLMETVA